MKSIADGLPPEIASQIHPGWRKNEVEYWKVRDNLLPQYRDQWIAFADGVVIASGKRPVEIYHAARRSGQHPFVICVGREEQGCRIRRVQFAYDTNYPEDALPIIDAEFRETSGTPGTVLDRVIPDTGADATTLPWADCQQMQLSMAIGIPGVIFGVSGTWSPSLAFPIWGWPDGQEYECQVQADFVGNERLLGRDVMNHLNILFRGPSGEVVVNP